MELQDHPRVQGAHRRLRGEVPADPRRAGRHPRRRLLRQGHGHAGRRRRHRCADAQERDGLRPVRHPRRTAPADRCRAGAHRQVGLRRTVRLRVQRPLFRGALPAGLLGAVLQQEAGGERGPVAPDLERLRRPGQAADDRVGCVEDVRHLPAHLALGGAGGGLGADRREPAGRGLLLDEGPVRHRPGRAEGRCHPAVRDRDHPEGRLRRAVHHRQGRHGPDGHLVGRGAAVGEGAGQEPRRLGHGTAAADHRRRQGHHFRVAHRLRGQHALAQRGRRREVRRVGGRPRGRRDGGQDRDRPVLHRRVDHRGLLPGRGHAGGRPHPARDAALDRTAGAAGERQVLRRGPDTHRGARTRHDRREVGRQGHQGDGQTGQVRGPLTLRHTT
ncbi:hypothetical protein SBRY_40861 [Actinacidiphila bryophytorum]|uniref:Uncharacterized protein n=1 Tax=Actinacidiphila bryophytorum TaxID=1436133 RepID=A0A9W4MCB9_9ACTN|nr:hypothetical protein SBRY_40861 [Actinacidiphila bryophytorum]